MPQPRAESPYAELSDILPKLAINIGWLKLMGEARVEQKRRQSRKTLSISPEGKAHAARKASARKVAQSRRKGYFGLAKAIMAA